MSLDKKNVVKIYISYSREDERLYNTLSSHLEPLKRAGAIHTFDQVKGGEEWETVIYNYIFSADIILLLISPDFFRSDYSHNIEMEHALDRHKNGDARVIPILWRSIYGWQRDTLGKLQALPKNGQAINLWNDIDTACEEVVREIDAVINDINRDRRILPPAAVEIASPVDTERHELPVPSLGERFNNQDGSILVYVPGGNYSLGSNPKHNVSLSPFWINKCPVTNQQFEVFLSERSGQPPRFFNKERFNHPLQPVVGVSWKEAMVYCRWAGGILPSEAQWEAAAQGSAGNRFPRGTEFDSRLANFDLHVGRPTRVGSYPEGAGPFGTLDQSGNVWEWCLDPWDRNAYEGRDGQHDPVAKAGEMDKTNLRVVRGGCWSSPAKALSTDFRDWDWATNRVDYLGFRMVYRGSPSAN